MREHRVRPAFRRDGDCARIHLAGLTVLNRILAYGLPALALFICVWVTRVFLAVDIVAMFMRMSGLLAIGSVAVVGGLLPSIPLGIAYGLIRSRPIAFAALKVAAIACVLELAFASLSVPWWSFITWWVLPTEAVVVLIVFPTAAWIGTMLFTRLGPVKRRRVGIGVFALLTLSALAWGWLYGCIRMGTCGFGS